MHQDTEENEEVVDRQDDLAKMCSVWCVWKVFKRFGGPVQRSDT